MSKVVPFCNEVGLQIPARFDTEHDKYVLDVPFPIQFDASDKRWLIEEGEIGWDEVIKRWKGRGPMNEEYVATLQRGHGH